MLGDVRRTHPFLLTSEGSSPNDRYAEPHAFLSDRSLPVPDRLQQGLPRWELSDPAPEEAGRAVAALASDSSLQPGSVDSLVLATSEVVANASVHGRHPVTVRGWSGQDAVVVAVHDHGAGPGYDELGLVPKPGPGSGLGFGLWIAHLLCDEVVQHVDDTGFTVRLRMRAR
ncbi:MAG TPA: ATP-binding protein [Segeticoccus sp.]|nr:ATP-binding protein [Segeticoccus sp.]